MSWWVRPGNDAVTLPRALPSTEALPTAADLPAEGVTWSAGFVGVRDGLRAVARWLPVAAGVELSAPSED